MSATEIEVPKVRYVYIIARGSGLPFFSVSYTCGYGIKCDDLTEAPLIKEDPTLFSGFLSAIHAFSSELGGELRFINLGTLSIHSYTTDAVIGILITDPTKNAHQIEHNNNRVRVITELFNETYKKLLNNAFIDTNLFSGFQKILEEEKLVDSNLHFKKNCQNCVYDKACPYRVILGPPKLSLVERLRKIPKLPPWKKLSQLLRAMRIYKPITEESENQTTDVKIRSVIVFHKARGTLFSGSFGCSFEPFRNITTKEKETLQSNLYYFLNTQFDQKKEHEQFTTFFIKENRTYYAHSIFFLSSWLILIEYEHSDKKQIQQRMQELYERFELLFADLSDAEMADIFNPEKVQALNETEPLALCSECNTTEECFVMAAVKAFWKHAH